MLLDRWLATGQFQERHSILIDAGGEDIYDALMALDLARSPFIGPLFALRQLPARLVSGGRAPRIGLAMEQFLASFIPLQFDRPEGFVVGAVGQFWRSSGGMMAVDPGEFAGGSWPGYAKLAMSFEIAPTGELVTMTRVDCPDAPTLRRFRPYWWLIRPASGLIRREMLRLTRSAAEGAG